MWNTNKYLLFDAFKSSFEWYKNLKLKIVNSLSLKFNFYWIEYLEN